VEPLFDRGPNPPPRASLIPYRGCVWQLPLLLGLQETSPNRREKAEANFSPLRNRLPVGTRVTLMATFSLVRRIPPNFHVTQESIIQYQIRTGVRLGLAIPLGLIETPPPPKKARSPLSLSTCFYVVCSPLGKTSPFNHAPSPFF